MIIRYRVICVVQEVVFPFIRDNMILFCNLIDRNTEPVNTLSGGFTRFITMKPDSRNRCARFARELFSLIASPISIAVYPLLICMMGKIGDFILLFTKQFCS
ncbi:hypothetical protein AGJ34_20440 [Cronobacter dublinensis subsp. dublinensis]|nr:hypothetical protein [Cronobacter dublinensis subsp. dublinensis]EGT5729675.1 hypothetical protein [Cronobacter dublinensis subsp. dublinensis]